MFKRLDQRVAVFIDAQNMYHSAKHLYSARVNFAALVDAAAAGRPVIRAVAYVAKSKTGEETAFFDALMQSGIELKIKDVQEFASGEKKSGLGCGHGCGCHVCCSKSRRHRACHGRWRLCAFG